MGDYMIELLPTGVLCIHTASTQSSEPGWEKVWNFGFNRERLPGSGENREIDHSVHITDDKETYKKKERMSLLFTFDEHSISSKML